LSDVISGKLLSRILTRLVVKVFWGFTTLLDKDGMPQKDALSQANPSAWGEISTAWALRLPGGHK
jgi:hypothetical protein